MLHKSQFSSQIFFIDSCASTMDIAKELSHQHNLEKSSFFIVTRTQTQGRGRLGRIWTQPSIGSTQYTLDFSPKQIPLFSDIYRAETLSENIEDFLPFTFALSIDELLVPLEWVSLLVGVALSEAFLTLYKFLSKSNSNLNLISKNEWNLFLKWPNDLIWNNKGQFEKIAGILCEAQMQTSSNQNPNSLRKVHYGISHIYIGIGINFFKHPNVPGAGVFFDKIVNSEINSLKLNQKEKLKILQKMSSLIELKLRKYLSTKYTHAQIKKFVLKHSVPIGTVLSVNQKSITGKFIDLNKHGALLLDTTSFHSQSKNISKIETIYSVENIDILNDFKNIICIDFGNTRIHITAQNWKSMSVNQHIIYEDMKSQKFHQITDQISKIFDFDVVEKIKIFYVSVNSKTITQQALRKIKSSLQTYLHGKKWLVSEVTEKDIFNRFPIPKTFDYKTLGADRALKCVYGYKRSQALQKNVLVFSFGTATTCEGFSSDGAMIENFVFPGMQMSFDALHHFTALLPKLKATRASFIQHPKYWTQKIYMQRGVLLSVASAILATAKLHAPAHVVFTGGNSVEIKKIIEKINTNDSPLEIEIVQNIETIVLAEFYLNQ